MTLAPEARQALLRSLGAADADLRQLVGDMLRSLEEAGDFLSDPTVPRTRGGPLGPEMPMGARVGPFRLLQKIGEGGFGVVYLAEQEQVRRRVALKVIKLGMDTRQVIARFDAERQALAMLEHPGIARIYDAGATSDGRPYFAMELVRGEPITAFCDSHRLGVRERLDLFREVCDAVQHAHQRGIIHRDIKPGNVLVALSDVGGGEGGRPVAKVIDFGIAKAIDHRLTERTLFTEHRQMIGTPEYMSPEQAEMTAVDVDTRTDVFSLGVLLYELLTGVTPLDARALRSAQLAQMQRLILDSNPARPSTRVRAMTPRAPGSNGAGGEPPDGGVIAERRRTDARTLVQGLRGDLDWIVMKAMEKDRTRRYATALSFSEDIGRHLRHEPVLAGPPSRLYRLRRMIRRNRGAFSAGACVVAALLLGLAASTMGFLSARKERDEATLHRAAAERLAYRSTLYAAQAAIAQADVGAAARALESAPQDLRGWEWEHLSWRRDASISSFAPFPDGPLTVHPLPDGDAALIERQGQPLSLFNVRSGTLLRTVGAPLAPGATVAVSSNAALALVSRAAGPLVMLDIASGAELWRKQSGYAASRGAFAPDGAQVAALIEATRQVVLLDARTGEQRSLHAPSIPAHSAPAFFDHGATLRYSAGPAGGGSCAALDPATGEARSMPVSTGGDSNRFSYGTAPDHIAVFDYSAEPARIMRLAIDGARVADIDLSADADLLAVGEVSGVIRLYDVREGRNADRPALVRTLTGHAAEITTVRFASDGRTLISSDSKGAVKVWSVGTDAGAYSRNAARVTFTEAISDDAGLAFGGAWGLASVYDVATGATVWSRNMSRYYLVASCFLPDSALAFADMQPAKSRIGVVDARTGADRGVGCTLPVRVHALAPGSDGRLLAACSDSTLRLIDIEKGEIVKEARGPAKAIGAMASDPATGMAFTCTGRGRGVLGDDSPPTAQDRELWVWDVRSLTVVDRLADHPAPVTAVALAPGALTLATACEDGSVARWDADDQGRWTRRWITSPASEPVTCLTISQSGSRIVAGAGSTLLVLDPARGEALLSLSGYAGRWRAARFSSDGGALAAASDRVAFVVFETAAAACGPESRAACAGASALVDQLYDELWVKDRVLARLESARGQDGLAPTMAAAALVEARGRADAVNYLNSECIGATIRADSDPREVGRAVEIMESVCRGAPETHAFQNTLALAYYRAARYGDCIRVASECIARTATGAGRRSFPTDLLLLAMARFRRDGVADLDALARARDEIEAQSLRGDYEVETLFAEAQQLLLK